MKYLAFLAILLGIIFVITTHNADAQIAENKAFLLSGNGFAVSSTTISDTDVEITFAITKTKTNTDFALEDGLITIDQNDLNISDFKGSILQNGKLFKFSGKATDAQGKQYSMTAVGKLIDKTKTESIYTLSGTLTDSSKKTTKLVYTSKVSEFTVKPVDKTPKSDVTIKILKGASSPETETYKTQTRGGFKFNFVSEDRITIAPGGTVTFVNEDDIIHSLKSGTFDSWSKQTTHNSFIPDNKISSGDIAPGKSWSVTFDEQGFFRLFDEKHQEVNVTIFVIDQSKSVKYGTPKNPLN